MLAILDYSAGNQTSVRRALDYLDIPCEITADPEKITAAQGLIFPGVGAAGQAMDELCSSGLDNVLGDQVKAEKPLLGICVGCQILLDYSQENDTQSLGVIPGECKLFDASLKDENGEPIRVPHMGWNSLNPKKTGDALLADVDPDAEFYFVHSYFPAPNEEYVIATTTYGMEFCSVLGREGLWAVQFHPEKSGRPGLAMLRNFHDYCLEAGHNAK